MLFFRDIFTFLTTILFLSVFSSFLSSFFEWNTSDLLLYTLIIFLGERAVFVIGLLSFRSFYLQGGLNKLLTYPVHIYYFSNTRKMHAHNLIFLIFYLFSIFIVLFYYSYENIFVGILLLLFGILYYIMFFNLIRSLIFLIRNPSLINSGSWAFDDIIKRYTPAPFEKSKYGLFLFLFPSSILGYLSLLVFKGNLLILNYILEIVLTFFFFLFLQYLLWRYGLRNYEAFG